MNLSMLKKPTLIISALVALGVGGAILAVPDAFYASNGITLGPNASLRNEIRAPGGALVGTGFLMLVGAFVPRIANTGLLIAATIFLGYGFARLLSMVIDGVPAINLMAASGLELTIGLLCLAVLVQANRYNP